MTERLPAPLVAADVDLRDFGYMPLEVVRLRDSELAGEASADVFRASVLLWCASWHQIPAGSLPNRDRTLADYSRTGARWTRIKAEVLAEWVECSDGRLYHPDIARAATSVWVHRPRAGTYQRFRAAVLARDGNACVYCGGTDGPFHLDHVIPRSRGGADAIENLATACGDCNRRKADKLLEEWKP